MPIVIESAAPGDVEPVLALLRHAQLPDDGVRELVPTLLVARVDGRVAGCAALEVYGRAALLRSVAVDPSLRGKGVGRQLTDAAIAMARRRDVRALYLLTETAATFFQGFGFTFVDRSGVPAALLASPEFAFLCPASAVAMARTL